MSQDPHNDCLAVLVTFDADSEHRIRAAAEQAATAIGRHVQTQGGRPHITLLPTRLSASELVDGVSKIARRSDSMSITLSHLGYFTAPGVCFLGAAPSPQLVELHTAICALAQPGDRAIFDGLYLPGSWVPHCTLAMGVSPGQLQPVADAVIRAIPLPFVVRAAALELVEISNGSVLSLDRVALP